MEEEKLSIVMEVGNFDEGWDVNPTSIDIDPKKKKKKKLDEIIEESMRLNLKNLTEENI